MSQDRVRVWDSRVTPACFFAAKPQLVPAPCCSPGAEADRPRHFCGPCTLPGPTANCQLPRVSPHCLQCRGHRRMACPHRRAILAHVCRWYVVSMSHSSFGVAGLSCGTLGMGTKQPIPPFHLCPQGDQVEPSRALESILQGGDSQVQSNAETRLTAKGPGGHRAAQVSCFSWRPAKPPSAAPGFGEIWSSAEVFLRHPGLRRLPSAPVRDAAPGQHIPVKQRPYLAPQSWVRLPREVSQEDGVICLVTLAQK